MDIKWVLIRSWHAVNGERTRCGRRYATTAEQVDTLPAGRSCESCLRVIARSVDVPA